MSEAGGSDGLRSDISPEQAAQMAQGSVTPESGHMQAEGFGGGQGQSWITSALRSTDPHRPIESVEGLSEILNMWDRYGVRGLEKLGGVDDAEAWVDLVRFGIGACAWAAGVGPGPSLSDTPDRPVPDDSEEEEPAPGEPGYEGI